MQNHPNNCVCGCHDEHKDTTGDDLYHHIEIDSIQCLNQRISNSCKNIIRPISEALNPAESDVKLISNQDDPDLLLQLSFQEFVRIRSIIVIGGPGNSAPTKMKVFVNKDENDISLLQATATQQIDLNPLSGFVLEYPTKITKFNNVGCISLGFDQNVGGDEQSTQIQFIGFRGQVIKGKKGGIVNAVYESKPNLKDHQAKDDDQVMKDVC